MTYEVPRLVCGSFTTSRSCKHVDPYGESAQRKRRGCTQEAVYQVQNTVGGYDYMCSLCHVDLLSMSKETRLKLEGDLETETEIQRRLVRAERI